MHLTTEILAFSGLQQIKKRLGLLLLHGIYSNGTPNTNFVEHVGHLLCIKLMKELYNVIKCNSVYYPKISPAVIVAVLNEDKLLLANNANFRSGWFSLIAGYADVGETLEETVRREVKEEVGLDVGNIRYYKSQPWALSGSLMIGFIAEVLDKTQPIQTDGHEITNAEWFSADNLPEHPSAEISIAGEMIELFKNGKLI